MNTSLKLLYIFNLMTMGCCIVIYSLKSGSILPLVCAFLGIILQLIYVLLLMDEKLIVQREAHSATVVSRIINYKHIICGLSYSFLLATILCILNVRIYFCVAGMCISAVAFVTLLNSQKSLSRKAWLLQLYWVDVLIILLFSMFSLFQGIGGETFRYILVYTFLQCMFMLWVRKR